MKKSNVQQKDELKDELTVEFKEKGDLKTTHTDDFNSSFLEKKTTFAEIFYSRIWN